MKTQHPKLKPTPRPLFSCGLFRHCARTVLSPTTPSAPPLPFPDSVPPPLAPPPLPAPSSNSPPALRQPPRAQSESESSSSSNTSQSFTQWRFPLPNSPISRHSYPPPEFGLPKSLGSHPLTETTKLPHPQPWPAPAPAQPIPAADLQELFHVVELQLSSGSDSDRVKAIHMLERSLVPNPPAAADGDESACPAAVMMAVVESLKEKATAKPATKVLLALCLAEANRRVAVEAGAAGQVVESLPELEIPAAERALAALELLCTVAEGTAEVRAHALAVPMMVEIMGKITARGKEYAISVLAVIFGDFAHGGEDCTEPTAPPEGMARAVELALQGDCTARGRRKGAQLLKTLRGIGRSDLTQEGK